MKTPGWKPEVALEEEIKELKKEFGIRSHIFMHGIIL